MITPLEQAEIDMIFSCDHEGYVSRLSARIENTFDKLANMADLPGFNFYTDEPTQYALAMLKEVK